MSSLNSILHRNKLSETGCRLFRFESLTSLSTKPTRRRQQWQVEANTLVLHFSHLDLDIESSEYNIGTFTQVLIFIRYFCSGISTCFVVLPLINAMNSVNLRSCHFIAVSPFLIVGDCFSKQILTPVVQKLS